MEYELLAAADLGSNSFRLQIGRVVGDQIYPLDTLKESVRLALGLMPDKMLDTASQARGLAALRQFGECLRGFHPRAVRAVATNTLRVAKNAPEFLREAELALGFPIEVIAGREEARLIYLGVVHSMPSVSHKRLVVDIGGGSTEFIIGHRIKPQLMESLYMGCVSYTVRFFPNGNVNKKSFRDAEVAAAREIENISASFLACGWKEAVGSSGTAREIADVLDQNGLNPPGTTGITRIGLSRFRAAMIKAGRADKMTLCGMREDRLPAIPGGLAIMSAVFDSLGIEQMNYGDGALRLGVLYDLLGRFHHQDMRDSTVASFMKRYHVDPVQAARVEGMAIALFAPLFEGTEEQMAEEAHFLVWAARLHEIGISVAHNAYHKHGAYILRYSDMPGFSKKEQVRLAFLVLGHRGKLERLTSLSAEDPPWVSLLCLRLAALFHRSRRNTASPAVAVQRSGSGYRLILPAHWRVNNAMTTSALEDELIAWKRVGVELMLSYESSG